MDFMFKERKIYWEFVGNAEHLGEYGNILIGGMRISEEERRGEELAKGMWGLFVYYSIVEMEGKEDRG